VRSRNVLQEVADRLEDLEEINRVKHAAAPRWVALKKTQDAATGVFNR
jgi:hypothetical protein